MKKIFILLAVVLPSFTFTACSGEEGDELPINNCPPKGVEAVDLGLSVKWADMNVGASSSEEAGAYFAWGEIKPKKEYVLDNYKYYRYDQDQANILFGGNTNRYTKYCTNSFYGYKGFTDNKTTLDPSDDAATVNWGSGWRMPTIKELRELQHAWSWKWCTQNMVDGYMVTGPNGNSIFLPTTGYYDRNTLERSSSGFYWSSSLTEGEEGTRFALNITFGDGVVLGDGSYRYIGYCIRPVCQ